MVGNLGRHLDCGATVSLDSSLVYGMIVLTTLPLQFSKSQQVSLLPPVWWWDCHLLLFNHSFIHLFVHSFYKYCVLPCIMHTHIFVRIIHRILIPMYNVHPYSPPQFWQKCTHYTWQNMVLTKYPPGVWHGARPQGWTWQTWSQPGLRFPFVREWYQGLPQALRIKSTGKGRQL